MTIQCLTEYDDITFTLPEVNGGAIGVEYLPILPTLHDFTFCLWLTRSEKVGSDGHNMGLLNIDRKRFQATIMPSNKLWINVATASYTIDNVMIVANQSVSLGGTPYWLWND